MKKQMVLSTVAAVGALSVLLSLPVRPASARRRAFRAAGPRRIASIQRRGRPRATAAALGARTYLNQPHRSALGWDPHKRSPSEIKAADGSPRRLGDQLDDAGPGQCQFSTFHCL